MMGRNFSLITPNEKMIPHFEELAAKYGLRDRLAGVSCMDFKIPELGMIFDNSVLKNKQLKEFTAGARKTVKSGTEVIIPIGGIAGLFLARSGMNQVDGVPVIDTITTAVKMTEMMVRLGKLTGRFVSRRLSFASPPEEILKELREEYEI
jgi:Asp/Glu/hydantoin racemase